MTAIRLDQKIAILSAAFCHRRYVGQSRMSHHRHEPCSKGTPSSYRSNCLSYSCVVTRSSLGSVISKYTGESYPDPLFDTPMKRRFSAESDQSLRDQPKRPPNNIRQRGMALRRFLTWTIQRREKDCWIRCKSNWNEESMRERELDLKEAGTEHWEDE